MAFTHKPDSGSLFKNEDRTEETHANAKGSALIDGVEWWVQAWTNKRDDGSKYQTLRFKRKEAKHAAPSKPRTPFDDMDSDIPDFS